MRHFRRLTCGLAILAVAGCTRSHYRQAADRQVYGIERERELDWRWDVPDRPVEASPLARIGDPYRPDREPIPLDDPAARLFQVTNGRHLEYHGWKKRGLADVENPRWELGAPFEADGALKIDRDSAMRVALLQSREYQFQVEELYLTALQLTLARFEFAVQPFANQQTFYNEIGGGKAEANQLTLNGQSGFTKTFYSGGQLLTNFANAMVFQFNDHGIQAITSNLAITFTQPLLRGAFARYVTQGLSLQERQTLYQLRTFAHYRRAFYVNIAASNGFLGLLQQLQSIRNAEQNLKTLARNLEEQEELARAGVVAQKDRDLISQQYQTQQVQLVAQQANLQTSFDQFKIVLGIPTEIEIRLDDSLLKIFELNDPRLDELRLSNDALYLALNQFVDAQPPSRELLIESSRKLKDEFATLSRAMQGAEDELRRWRMKLGQVTPDGEELPLPIPSGRPLVARQIELSGKLRRGLGETRRDFAKNEKALLDLIARIPSADPKDSWKELRDLSGGEFRGRLADVFVVQTQTRVFLIEIPEDEEIPRDQAIAIALNNRLDLMNARGLVTDTWRNEEVQANQLLADLSIVYNGNLNTNPKKKGIFEFESEFSRHSLGIEFDAPLVRRAERNSYKASQIAYQQARRGWQLARDTVVQDVRLDVRTLDLSRRQFEIGREQLVTAARQVEEAEYDQRTKRSTTESSNTLFLVTALGSLLNAKNGLITSWVNYQAARMNLYRDLDIMQIDARGVWTNEPFDPDFVRCLAAAADGNVRIPPSRRRKPPRILSRVAAGLAIASAVLGTAYYAGGGLGFSAKAPERPLSVAVRRANLSVIVTERGNLESTVTVDGVCELTGLQNKIIMLVPEGSKVKKGDVVCKFDAGEIEKNIAQQDIKAKQAQSRIETTKQEIEIAENKGDGEVLDADVEAKLAKGTLTKYEKADFPAEVADIKGNIAQQESKADEARVKRDQTSDLVKKGFRSPEQLRGAQTEYEQYRYFLERDKEKLNGKKEYEYQLKTLELTSKVQQAESKKRRAESTRKASVSKAISEWEAARATHGIEERQLKEFLKQKEYTAIKAEQDGVVAYANDRYWDPSSQVREGAAVYSRQKIFSLPDMAHMQVKVNIHESLVKKVKVGQKAEIRVDAFPNLILPGVVKSVSQLADSTRSFFSGGSKEYSTIVTIEAMPEEGLKPGMTAEVQIRVNLLKDILIVPVQAVVEHKGKHFSFVEGAGGKIAARALKVGDSNEKHVQILEGLAEGEIVALDARNRAEAEFKAENDKDGDAKPSPPASPGAKP